MVWAFDKVRKRIQQIYGKKYRLLFKHSKRLLIKRNVKLKDWKKERSNSLLYISDEMLQAYYLKEQFYKIMDANDRQTAKQLMSDWISSAESCNIEEYKYCAKTLLNWQTEILNSFDVRLFKGFAIVSCICSATKTTLQNKVVDIHSYMGDFPFHRFHHNY